LTTSTRAAGERVLIPASTAATFGAAAAIRAEISSRPLTT
jgi:hypothetical protein